MVERTPRNHVIDLAEHTRFGRGGHYRGPRSRDVIVPDMNAILRTDGSGKPKGTRRGKRIKLPDIGPSFGARASVLPPGAQAVGPPVGPNPLPENRVSTGDAEAAGASVDDWPMAPFPPEEYFDDVHAPTRRKKQPKAPKPEMIGLYDRWGQLLPRLLLPLMERGTMGACAHCRNPELQQVICVYPDSACCQDTIFCLSERHSSVRASKLSRVRAPLPSMVDGPFRLLSVLPLLPQLRLLYRFARFPAGDAGTLGNFGARPSRSPSRSSSEAGACSAWPQRTPPCSPASSD